MTPSIPGNSLRAVDRGLILQPGRVGSVTTLLDLPWRYSLSQAIDGETIVFIDPRRRRDVFENRIKTETLFDSFSGTI